MPKIVGLVTKAPRAIAERQLLSMLRTISNDTLYNAATWMDEPLGGVYVG